MIIKISDLDTYAQFKTTNSTIYECDYIRTANSKT